MTSLATVPTAESCGGGQTHRQHYNLPARHERDTLLPRLWNPQIFLTFQGVNLFEISDRLSRSYFLVCMKRMSAMCWLLFPDLCWHFCSTREYSAEFHGTPCTGWSRTAVRLARRLLEKLLSHRRAAFAGGRKNDCCDLRTFLNTLIWRALFGN